MATYPSTLLEFERLFPTEDSCIDYLVQVRWPEGVRCPGCQCEKTWRTGYRLICSSCRHNIRVMSGTIFQDSHLPLMLWFRAMWLIVSHKFGANAMGLHQTLGMSYTTAWNLLHKLRKAMVRPGRELLSGMVEVDETYIGGLAEGSPGRSGEKKALVVIAIELRGKSLGRVRMRVIASATSENLIGFVKDNVEVGSAVITDGWSAYSRLMEQGYGHNVMSVRPGQEVLSNVHLIVSLLKRWLLGTYQGAVDKKRLEYYLDEYTFRFNRRKSRGRGKLFLRLIEQAVVTEPVTRKQIRRLE